MPGQSLYTAGFGLSQGMVLNGYQLVSIEIGHKQIRRYKEYSYPSKLVWRPQGSSANKSNLISSLNSTLGGTKIINSEYGNPYSCNFGALSYQDMLDGSVVVTATGTCIKG